MRSNASAVARSSPLSPSAVDLDGVALARETVGQSQHQTGFVFDEQEAFHASGGARRLRGAERFVALQALFGGDRQVNDELAAAALGALDLDRAAVSLDDALDERQAEPGALNLRRDRRWRAIERFEDVRLIGGRDADATIARR